MCGSSVMLNGGATGGRGFYLDAGGNLPDDFEVAFLLSNIVDYGNMTGIAVLDASGNGIGFSMYSTAVGIDLWAIASYAYSSTLAQNTATYPNAAQNYAPLWLSLERSTATSWNALWSTDGTTWTTAHSAVSRTVTNARRIFVGQMYNGGTDYQGVVVHRCVYGTPDLGL